CRGPREAGTNDTTARTHRSYQAADSVTAHDALGIGQRDDRSATQECYHCLYRRVYAGSRCSCDAGFYPVRITEMGGTGRRTGSAWRRLEAACDGGTVEQVGGRGKNPSATMRGECGGGCVFT